MTKRLSFVLISLLLSTLFFVILGLPYEWQHFAIAVSSLWVIFVYWLALGLLNYKDWKLKILLAFLPLVFFVGYCLFVILLPFSVPLALFLSALYLVVNYVIFLVENIFLVAIGYRTVPLYRAAYVVALIVLLIASFFLFNSIFTFNLGFWQNGLAVFGASMLIFGYLFWAITIELPDDGKNKSLSYIWVPALILGQLSVAFSFWPIGIFKRSIFLVSIIYVLATLIQADIKERLFAKTWKGMLWVFVALVLGIVTVSRWR